MQLLIQAATVATVFAAGALCQQIAIPPHASTFNGFSRGFHYTAPVDHVITRLDLPVDAFQAGDTASYLVRINGATALSSAGNAGAIATAILVQTGDLVDVIGNWSPAVTGNLTAHNSYGSSAPYASAILGNAVTLFRTGWQWDVGDPAYASGTYLSPSGGSLGRVLVDVAPPSGLFADFTSNVTTGASPLTVLFADASISHPNPILTWAWDFENDGSIDSTLRNPAHTYSACGVYDVALTVADGINPPATVVKTAYITTDEVSADFTDTLVAPLVVQFTDSSIGAPTAWDWDLDGDGLTDSTAQNPAFNYQNTNPVQVTLTVSRQCGPSDTTTRTVVPAQQLTTLFAGGNSGSPGWTVFYDLVVTNPAGITITSIDHSVLAAASNAFSVEVHLTSGGHAGRTQTPEAWRLVGTAAGTSAGSGAPSNTPMATPIYVPFGSYGVAIHYLGTGMQYTDGNGPNQTYANADLALALGTSVATLAGAPFGGGTTFTPRVWNGTIYYGTCQFTGLAGYGYAGGGCAGSIGASTLTPSAAPRIGTTLTVAVDNLPASAGVMITGLSNTTSILGPLPLDGGAFGAPGCALRVSPDANRLILGVGNAANWTLTIPNDPSLTCLVLYQQALVLDPGFNAGGAVMSEATAILIGS
ncbi:MAG: PKD domain-containing protein [Planctomycetes bacterium]|nr:PKD domain-containing protein [Planctomycetota bacterium]